MTFIYTVDEQTSDMRHWLNRKMPGIESIIDRMSHADLMVAIDKSYDGGYAHFIEVHGDITPTPVDDTHLDAQIALRRRFLALLGRPFAIAACHELIRVERDETRVKLLLRVIDEEERGTRLIQRGATIRLLMFDTSSTRLLPDETMEIKDPDWSGDVIVNSHVRVMDRDRFADKFWQWHECYRPGNEKAPLDGCYGPTRKDSRHDEYRTFRQTMEAIK